MPDQTPEETIEEITLSKEVVTAEHELTSSRKKVFNKYIVAIAIILVGILFTYYFLSPDQLTALQDVLNKDNHKFYWMLLVGFGAELIAGSMGMGYGVICTSLLLILNVPPAVVSASIHSAEAVRQRPTISRTIFTFLFDQDFRKWLWKMEKGIGFTILSLPTSF